MMVPVAAAWLSFARLHSVPDSAIALDANGLNTRTTIRSASRLARQHGLAAMGAVRHFYHLPRIKKAADREALAGYTVPGPRVGP